MMVPVGSTPAFVAWGAFALLLAAACVSDLRTRRIPNALVLALAAAGLVFAVVSRPWLAGLGFSLGGLATGLAIWLPFWLLGMMGAGDVKLFAAGAAWLGAGEAVEAALLAAFAGGALSLLYWMVAHGPSLTFMRLAQGVHEPAALRGEAPERWQRRMPYGLAMAAGLLLAAWRPGFLF